MTETITHDGLIIAIIIRANYKRDGVEFFTPNQFSQQLGYMNRPCGYKVEAHTHKKIQHDVQLTHEVQFVKSGRIKVGLYNDDRTFIEERILSTGDVILLASGGHSVEMLEDSELIEVKQGPYSDDDKQIFTQVTTNDD